MLGIIRIARHVAAIERRAVVGRQRKTVAAGGAAGPGLEMKMRPNAMASAWPSADRRIRGLAGKAAGGDQHALPDRAEQHHRRRHVLMVDLGAAGAARSAAR